MLGRESTALLPVKGKQLLRGKLVDRPWGMTLYALGLAARPGELTITTADRKVFRIVLAGGVVVDASSPLSADTLARVALTHRLIPALHAAEITKRMRKPGGDELAIAAEVTHLRVDELARLRRLAIGQRAARTFALEAGTYRFEHGKMPVGPASELETEIDIEEVIFAGARLYLADDRMTTDLRLLGSQFVMKAEASATVARFAFSSGETPILQALDHGTSLAEIEAVHRDIDPRSARAAIYALACSGVVERTEPEPAHAITHPRTTTATLEAPAAGAAAASWGPRQELETLVADRCSLIDVGRDLFAVLGLEFDASVEAVHGAYLELAGYLHPELTDHVDAERLYSRATIAHATLTTPEHRACYIKNHLRVTDPTTEILVVVADEDRAAMAREAVLRAARLMTANRPGAAVAELAKACELAPASVEYGAMLAWAAFCAAPRKQRHEVVTRRCLERALEASAHPELLRTYLGRMERMLGHDLEALGHFRAVLARVPEHAEATAEVAAIEARLARGTQPRL